MRRLLHLALLAPVACCACTSPEEAGVHVEITLDAEQSDSWAGILFDHVTVVATGADKKAVVCLFPTFETTRELEIEGDDTDGDPCADAHTAPWSRVPDVESWALGDSPRRINFVFPEGAEVEVVATARLGGGGPAARGSADVAAASEFPSTTVALRPLEDAPVLGPGLALLDEIPDELDPLLGFGFICDVPVTAVPCPVDWLAAGTQKSSHALACVGEKLRIFNPPGVTCPDLPEAAAIVMVAVGKPPDGPSLKVKLFVRGRFSKCKTGDPLDPAGCETTTACTPPPTGVLLGPDSENVQGVDFSKLPPSPVSMVFSFEITVPSEPYASAIFQEPQAAGAPDACFFELEDIGAQVIPQ